MYAVIKTGGKQYKVSKDDIISVEKLSEDSGKKVKLNEVLVISDKGKPIIGNPLIKGASVEAEILEQTRSKKITVFKKKRRHNYRRKQGHKQLVTNLKILSINSTGTKSAKSEKAKTEDTKKKTTTTKKTATTKKTTTTKKTVAKKKAEDKTKKTATKGKEKTKTSAKGSKE
ncbi:MAG: 50S ribosomal protein L21 [Pseudomonadota bacterium]|nr:50S ribosomal protein L21 [Pseudomonadota bacterium]MEC9392721.1 50S ribosomal protein L21 [Pseudomonadota bacterium]MEC9459228.1 50S ribosomal protein L21 [Pseudomonadota bacterium]MED5437295.1 50S ribosomal protein L21 [Pseudomonadota bacterium]